MFYVFVKITGLATGLHGMVKVFYTQASYIFMFTGLIWFSNCKLHLKILCSVPLISLTRQIRDLINIMPLKSKTEFCNFWIINLPIIILRFVLIYLYNLYKFCWWREVLIKFSMLNVDLLKKSNRFLYNLTNILYDCIWLFYNDLI